MNILTIAPEFYNYSLYIKGYSKNTIRRYKYVLELFAKLNPEKQVETITEANIRSFLLYGRTERQWSANTAIVFHKTLFVFFRWAVASLII